MTTSSQLPTPEQLERQLAHFINVTLLGGAANVGRDTRLFEDGYMNSLRILDLIAAVEKSLGARIPDRAVKLANFRTIATIVAAFHPDASRTASAAPPDRLFERHGDRTRFASPLGVLQERGEVVVTAAGQVSLSGLALDVLRAVDHSTLQWARSLGATERRYPSLFDLGVLVYQHRSQSHRPIAKYRRPATHSPQPSAITPTPNGREEPSARTPPF